MRLYTGESEADLGLREHAKVNYGGPSLAHRQITLELVTVKQMESHDSRLLWLPEDVHINQGGRRTDI